MSSADILNGTVYWLSLRSADKSDSQKYLLLFLHGNICCGYFLASPLWDNADFAEMTKISWII